MTRKANVLTVSIIAVMAVCSARADIASTTYVNAQLQPVTAHIADDDIHVTAAQKTAWSGKQDAIGYTTENVANKLTAASYTSNDDESETKYPTIKLTNKLVNDAVEDVTETITGIDQAVTGLGTGKQNKLTSTGNSANVVSDGDGNVVTEISAANGVVTVTKGTTLGDLATKSSVAESDLASALATKINGKQDAIDDLSTIRSGAAAGATAVQPAAISDMETQTHASSTYQAKALVTSMDANSSDAQYPSAKAVYNAIEAAKTTASGGASTALQDAKDYADGKFQIKSTEDLQVGTTGGAWRTLNATEKAALASGIDSTKVGKIATNESAIATLNGNASTNGSVAKSIADAIDGLDLANTYQAKGNYATAAQGVKADTALQPTAASGTSGTKLVEYDSATGLVTGGQTAGALASKSTVGTNDIDAKAVTSAKLSDDVNASLAKADTAIQSSDLGTMAGEDKDDYYTKTAADAAFATEAQGGKADTALQTVTANAGDGVVTNIAKDGTAVTMTKAKVTGSDIADNAAIAKTQLASGVQASLGYADAYNVAQATYGDIITHDADEFQAAGNYIIVPASNSVTGKSVLTYDADANSGAGAYYWEVIGR